MFSGISPIAIAEKYDLKIIGTSDELINSIGSINKQGRDFILWVKNQNNLNKMSPEQLEQLRNRLHAVANTMKINQVDPNKIDASKTKGTAAIQQDLNAYQKKYTEGKIHNSIVKSPGDNQ